MLGLDLIKQIGICFPQLSTVSNNLSCHLSVVIYVLFLSSCRKKLFDMINDLPTIFETITGVVKKQGKEKSSSVSNNSSTKSKANPEVCQLKIKLITVHWQL